MRKFGLIGKSLEHSWSKDYFEEKFKREKITDCIYENFPLEDLKGLRELILSDKTLSGLNITTPFKIKAIRYMDELDPVAESIGSVNCVKISRTGNFIRLKGYNTDMAAFRETLIPLSDEPRRRALVLGTGGAAHAVCHALKDINIEYSGVSRTGKSGTLTYTGITSRIMDSHRLIINATPVGMFPHQDRCPAIPYQYLTSNHLLYDLIYNPEVTLFLKKGREAGTRIKNGLEMLQKQAELSWKIWNDKYIFVINN